MNLKDKWFGDDLKFKMKELENDVKGKKNVEILFEIGEYVINYNYCLN